MKKGILFGLFALLMSCGLTSCKDGSTPYIGENGNWWIDDKDLGVSAQGSPGPAGQNGLDGQDGSSITVLSVSKVSSTGLVDTYKISFSDGTQTTFTVTNGEANSITGISYTSSLGNVDTYTISFSNGSSKTFSITNGKDGSNLTINSIELKSSEGLIDTYVINYSDGSKFEFVVSNGADGKTPFIGENGNWWIDDVDTGVLADWEKANNVEITAISSGLEYRVTTIDGKSGFVVTGWDITKCDDDYFYAKYGENLDNLIDESIIDTPLVIPNYIGSVPVIGIDQYVRIDYKKVVLSSNTIFLGNHAFYSCRKLQEIDFNGSKLICIPEYCFANTSLKNIIFPDSLTHVFDYAFDGVNLESIELNNVKYIGNHAFDDAFLDYIYLNTNIEYVGTHAFDTPFVYVEANEKPSAWGSISDGALSIVYGVKNNGEYLYSIDSEEVTVYQYLGNHEKVTIPQTIDDKPITKIGCGFNSYVFDNDIFAGMKDNEIFAYLKNKDGYIKELVIGNNVKAIEEFALMNGNMFVYVKDSVEMVYLADAHELTGCYYGYDIDDDDVPFSLFVIEDSLKTKFTYNGCEGTYDDLASMNSDYLCIFRADIAYSDIYVDNDIYYVKDVFSYELIACKDNYFDYFVIPNAVNSLPVTIIGKYAFTLIFFNKLAIGANVNRIRTGAFSNCEGKVFLPKTVSIINAYGVDLSSESIIYSDASSKKDDWDSNWNSSSTIVNYSTTIEYFDSL